MARKYTIHPQELKKEEFAPYGEAIMLPNVPAPKIGENWECWNRIISLGYGNPSLGIVKTRPASGQIRVMERHPKPELLIPITAPVVQAVGLCRNMENGEVQPDAATVRAFIIYPQQAILMSPGTWHWAALPLEDEEAFYIYMTEPTKTENNFGNWVGFRNDEYVQIQT